MAIFWMTPCLLVESCQRFCGRGCLYLEGLKRIL